jgi:hypothetical protein
MYALILAMVITSPSGINFDLSAKGVCEAYGVIESPTDSYRAPRIEGYALEFDELQEVCNMGEEVYGCTKWDPKTKIAKAYWLKGDWCSEVHEACHAWHLRGHTEEFIWRWWNEPEKNVACPVDQLGFGWINNGNPEKD